MSLLLAVLMYCSERPGYCVPIGNTLYVCGAIAEHGKRIVSRRVGGLRIVTTECATA